MKAKKIQGPDIAPRFNRLGVEKLYLKYYFFEIAKAGSRGCGVAARRYSEIIIVTRPHPAGLHQKVYRPEALFLFSLHHINPGYRLYRAHPTDHRLLDWQQSHPLGV